MFYIEMFCAIYKPRLAYHVISGTSVNTQVGQERFWKKIMGVVCIVAKSFRAVIYALFDLYFLSEILN